MINNKFILGACCALALAVCGCSRQQSDWQKTREANTADAYEQFLKKYPSGEFTAQAQARSKELYEERDWQKARDGDTPEAYQAFLKQYPEGKWTEEARIRVENFTLAQAPSGVGAQVSGTAPGTGPAGAYGAALGTAAGAASAPRAESTSAAPDGDADTAAPAKLGSAKRASKAAQQSPSAAAATSSGSGAYGVQLGAFKSGAKAADERWAHLRKEYPAVLAGLSSRVVSKQTPDGKLYRLQARGLTEKHAREVCSALKARSQACVVVPPTNG